MNQNNSKITHRQQPHIYIQGFSIIELIIIITIISIIIISSAPSLFGVFKRQFLKLSTNQLTQDIRDIQSNAFIEHQYHKVEFQTDNNYFVFPNGYRVRIRSSLFCSLRHP